MIAIEPARMSSLAAALSDNGQARPWRDFAWRVAGVQLAQSDAWQVSDEAGEALCVGGFAWRDDLGAAEVWFSALPVMRRKLRRALTGAAHVVDSAVNRYGAVVARVKTGERHSERLVTLLGFIPSALVEGGYRYWRKGEING